MPWLWDVDRFIFEWDCNHIYFICRWGIEIVSLVYKGFTNAEIAEMREITLSTVKRHVYNVFKKLDVSNRVEMIHMIKNDWFLYVKVEL